MKLSELAAMIDAERELHDEIDAEIRKWVEPGEHTPETTLRIALRAFGRGSLRKNAMALCVSPTYLSLCETGKQEPSRALIARMHRVFGLGAEEATK